MNPNQDSFADPHKEGIPQQVLQGDMMTLCISKTEEFAMLGYEHVTAEEVWECVNARYKKGQPALHQIVNDILSLRITKFMNYITMRMYKQG